MSAHGVCVRLRVWELQCRAVLGRYRTTSSLSTDSTFVPGFGVVRRGFGGAVGGVWYRGFSALSSAKGSSSLGASQSASASYAIWGSIWSPAPVKVHCFGFRTAAESPTCPAQRIMIEFWRLERAVHPSRPSDVPHDWLQPQHVRGTNIRNHLCSRILKRSTHVAQHCLELSTVSLQAVDWRVARAYETGAVDTGVPCPNGRKGPRSHRQTLKRKRRKSAK